MRPGDNPDYDRHNEPEFEPDELEEMQGEDWLEKWELENGLQPNLLGRHEQFAVSVATDAFRICIGITPRRHSRETVTKWMAAVMPLPSPPEPRS